MPIEVTVRHKDVPERAQEYAREKAATLVQDFPRIEHVHVILDHQKHLHVAETVVQAKNHVRTEAEESSENMKASIDAAFEKTERQLRRVWDRIQDHKSAMETRENMKAGEAAV